MYHQSFHLAIAAAAFLVFGPTAWAQRAVFNPYPALSLIPSPNSPYAQPPISPYLNLLRGGDPSVNYFLNVVPMIDKRNQAFEPAAPLPPRLDPELDAQFQESVGRRPLGKTGLPTGFLIYYGAYPTTVRGYAPYPLSRTPTAR